MISNPSYKNYECYQFSSLHFKPTRDPRQTVSQGQSGTFNPQALQRVIEDVRYAVNHSHIICTLTTGAKGLKFRKEYINVPSIN